MTPCYDYVRQSIVLNKLTIVIGQKCSDFNQHSVVRATATVVEMGEH